MAIRPPGKGQARPSSRRLGLGTNVDRRVPLFRLHFDVDRYTGLEFCISDRAVEGHFVDAGVKHVEGCLSDAFYDVRWKPFENRPDASGHIVFEAQSIDHLDQRVPLGMHLTDTGTEVRIGQGCVGSHHQLVTRKHRAGLGPGL